MIVTIVTSNLDVAGWLQQSMFELECTTNIPLLHWIQQHSQTTTSCEIIDSRYWRLRATLSSLYINLEFQVSPLVIKKVGMMM